MRFQTIGLLALFIIVMGAIGIYKSEDLNKMSHHQETENLKPQKVQEKVFALAIKVTSNAGTFVSRDSFEFLPATFDSKDKGRYITEDEIGSLASEIFILKHKMDAGQFISSSDLENLKNRNFTDLVLRVDRSSIENFSSDFYNVYWHFNKSGRDKNSRRVKLFSKNVFIRPIDHSKEEEKHMFSKNSDHEDLSPVVFSVNDDVIERYLQADQLGYFKIVNVTKKNINLENYSTLEVDSSKEIQPNDISSSYKYDVNFIK
ncbi:hypothetical protein [Vibrio sp. AND4]|uniref:hypothetical protein n=1 Tax=Vibrio sp. AND4 TaxID=314289 RepID=UPI00015F33E9|nr:hypothetical protein [Vibrio sp. AND4]EDP59617.1 hypothetical protein AND4_10684 [Vibrio sp. AND4]